MVWAPLPGAEEFLVSNDGDVINTNTGKSPRMGEAHGENKRDSFRFKAGRLGTMAVAKAVALAFALPLPPGRFWNDGKEKLEVHHINSVTSDNRVENLEVLAVSAHRRKDAALRAEKAALSARLSEFDMDARAHMSGLLERLWAGAATGEDFAAAARRLLAARGKIKPH